MMRNPIHKNLNTAFVNLAALVRHLRTLQFVGTIHVEMSSYEADIEFTAANTMRASEHDHVEARIAYGEKALQRIIVRAKEPGGRISVYRGSEPRSERTVFVDRAIIARANRMIADTGDTPVRNFCRGLADLSVKLPAGNKACDNTNEHENWTEVLNLVSELLRTVDESFSRSNINFSEAFKNACGFISGEHPFLDPDSDVFSYIDGFISVRQRLSGFDLASGIVAALARILNRLREDSYFRKTHHLALHRIRVLANQRKSQFDRHLITNQLEHLLGV